MKKLLFFRLSFDFNLFFSLLSLFIALSLFSQTASAEYSDWFYNAEDAIILINISSSLSSPSSVKEAEATLFLFPKNDSSQSVLFLATEPSAVITPENITFKWFYPLNESFLVKSIVKTKRNFVPIEKKVQYPMDTGSMNDYLKESEKIVITPKIRKMASEIAHGKDDSYVIASDIAFWIEENIEYNLSSLTAEATQSSEWVLENKYGVCDELTILYIAMLRSIGIPARFVSGVSYTNTELFKNPYGPHAWAEVWLGKWVPVDIVYKEFGFVDPGHIKLSASEDKKESILYSWKSYSDIDIETSDLKITTAVESYTPIRKDIVVIDANVIEKVISLDSKEVFAVKVKNPNNFYFSSTIIPSETEGLEFTPKKKHFTLAPGEEKTFYFISRFTKDLNPMYEYTFPVAFYISTSEKAQTFFTAKYNGKKITDEQIGFFLKNEGTMNENMKLKIECNDRREYYTYEDAMISCNITNIGNKILEGIKVCVNEECQVRTLYLQDKIDVYRKIEKIAGNYSITISTTYDSIENKQAYFYEVKDEPSVLINFSYPEKVPFNEPIIINLYIFQDSNVKNASLNFKLSRMSDNVVIEEKKLSYTYTIDSSKLRKKNHGKILLKYQDINGREYFKEYDFDVEVYGQSLMEKIRLFFNKFY